MGSKMVDDVASRRCRGRLAVFGVGFGAHRRPFLKSEVMMTVESKDEGFK
jgi:hypothetical protein